MSRRFNKVIISYVCANCCLESISVLDSYCHIETGKERDLIFFITYQRLTQDLEYHYYFKIVEDFHSMKHRKIKC